LIEWVGGLSVESGVKSRMGRLVIGVKELSTKLFGNWLGRTLLQGDVLHGSMYEDVPVD